MKIKLIKDKKAHAKAIKAAKERNSKKASKTKIKVTRKR